MKTINRFIRCLAIVTTAAITASCTEGKFHIEGNITEAKDSVLYLEHMGLNGPEKTDSVRLKEDGRFAFSGERPDAPDFYRLRIAGNIINISIDSTETVKVTARGATMAREYTVEGSQESEVIKELAIKQQDLTARVMSVQRSESMGVRQTEDSIQRLIEAYKEEIAMNYIFKAPQKASSYFALFQTLGSQLIFNPRENNQDIRCFAAVATSWDTYYPGNERSENLHNIALEGLKTMRILQAKAQSPVIDPDKVEVTTIIDVPLPDSQGRQRSLTELKGKVVMLDFHSFAIDGSRDRIMEMRQLYNKYHDQGFEIYQVSVDANEHFWKTQTAALPWVNVYEPDGTSSQYLRRYNVQSIPTFFLIDRNNALYKRDAQIEDLDNEIKSLL